MKLRTIEISGFKSFADHTKIEFKDGITGIVGPNGSGKSNIIEAIRWVMGENSAKSLRGGKMPDVIFSGTEKRKPLSRASVTITFDNSDHFLDSKYDEVMISRRLFRNGDSQFELNKQECRLKDILSLFIDTGLGRESFSIISQGRVESIFNSKPEDRRAIIEEAAGVLEYKQDKKRAEHELEKTSGYLERVNDLIVELEKQVKPLEEQAAVAKDYVDQKKRFDILDQTKLYNTIIENQAQQQVISNDEAQLNEELKGLKEQFHLLSEQREEIKNEIANQNQQKDALQVKQVKLNRLEQQLKGQKDLKEEHQKYVAQEKARLNTEQERLNTQLQQEESKLDKLSSELKSLKDDIKQTKTQLSDLDSENQIKIQNDLKSEIDNLRADYMQKLQELTSLKNQLNFNEQGEKRDQQQREKFQLDIDTFNQQLTTQVDKLENLNEQIGKLNDSVAEKSAEVDALKQKQNSELSNYESLRQQWLQGSDVVHRAESKLVALKNIKNEYTGFYQGVKAILQQKTQFKGILGPVSDVINVPKDYTTAIETALGNQVQNVVVDSDQTAKSAIEFLKKNRQGRVTFLPKNALKPRKLSQDVLGIVSQMTGFIGSGAELVQTSSDNQIISQYLLGTTLIVDNLKNALSISKNINRRARIITLTGDVIGVGGTMTGGASQKNQRGVLSQDQEITQLETQLSEMKNKLQLKEDAVKNSSELSKSIQIELDQSVDALASLKESQGQLANEISLAEDRKLDLERRLKSTQFELSQLLEENGEESDLPTRIQDLQVEVESIKKSTGKKQAQLELLNQDSDERQDQVAQLRVDLAKNEEQARQKQVQIEELQDNILNINSNLQAISKQIEDLNNDVVDDSEMTQADLADIVSQLSDVNAQFNQLQEKLTDNQVKQDQILTDYELVQQKIIKNESSLQEKVGTLNLVNSRIETAIDKLSDEYEQTFESVQKVILTDIDNETLNRDLKLLRKGINELGSVNVGAIEEYDRVSERYNFLTEQKADLLDSKSQLEQSIAEIDEEAGLRFKQTFDAVAVEFSKVFVKMFGGGQAELELTDPDNILTTGIEIKAQPPGKKLQRLSLLSGGEKSLTAITLLFAILQVKPVPFCILDEVEAAFDDANVDRFAKYLNVFHDTTQFIVITHRKGTMIQADVLYGVTMQESGVSKMVSVEMDEAE